MNALLAEIVKVGTGVIIGAVGMYAIAISRHAIERHMVAILAGVIAIGAIDPVVRLSSVYSGHFFEFLGGVMIVSGLSIPLVREIRRRDWGAIISGDPRGIRPDYNWMMPMDDEILDIMDETDLVLTPAVIAYNTGYSREAVNRRLSTLEEHRFVVRVERGKYRLGERGQDYLHTEAIVTQDPQVPVASQN